MKRVVLSVTNDLFTDPRVDKVAHSLERMGCAVLLVVNLLFVPKYGYMACAWGGAAGYGVAMLASYFVGQKYYPLDYPLKDISLYVVLAFILYGFMVAANDWPTLASLAFNTLIILVFAGVIIKRDLPLSQLPVIGKHFKKS